MKYSHFFRGHFHWCFFGHVWGNLGKNLSHPQKFAGSYTYAPNTVSSVTMRFSDCPWPATFNVILYTSCLPEFWPRGAFLWVWMLWSVSARKLSPKFSLSLNNWFLREIDFYNLDPLLDGTPCCLIHWSWKIRRWIFRYDSSGIQKLGLIWFETIAIWNGYIFLEHRAFAVLCMGVEIRSCKT